MQTFISKARKPKFDFYLKILDLNNVPLVSGTSYVKWHLPSSIAAEHRGRTDRKPIKEHKVNWEYRKTIPVRLTIDKSNILQGCTIQFEVVQDYSSGGSGEKITLGHVTLNLAEYVEESESGDREGEGEGGGVTRRYLMQESKINSTLKIGIAMKQIEGDRNYIAPPLKMAPVFGGIAGIMTGEQGDREDVGHLPILQKSRDASELQDMYRHALAASWHAQLDELPADECIEDIFAGGDGFRKIPEKNILAEPQVRQEDSGGADDNNRQNQSHRRVQSSSSLVSQSTITAKARSPKKHARNRTGSAQSNNSSNQQDGNTSETFRSVHLVDEFDFLDDLVAWKLLGKIETR